MGYKKDQSLLNYIQYCKEMDVPLVVIVGEAEKENGSVELQNLTTNEEVWEFFFNLKKYFLRTEFEVCAAK